MSSRKHAASVSHSESTIAELRADRAFAVEYLKSAMEELDNSEHRAVGLLALRDVAEAYGGLGLVAQEAGITREALYRALSPTGNPTLKTLLAVLHALELRLSVAPAERTVSHA
ncbi:hypothetical protein D3C87_1276310 [compost metagenome]|uniref:addiction module antidote protein n=1 Tax=Achromobacter sp. Root83 TaxID=1736602 RepID=UPI00070BFC13|nr:addiction module antidote protein [Achromobacter sp. Root83]KRC73123.1 transcriptional regulator [Achromobacter sp. Root83]